MLADVSSVLHGYWKVAHGEGPDSNSKALVEFDVDSHSAVKIVWRVVKIVEHIVGQGSQSVVSGHFDRALVDAEHADVVERDAEGVDADLGHLTKVNGGLGENAGIDTLIKVDTALDW